MIVYFAGAKEETKSEPFSDPRIAVNKDLNMMVTFYEFKGKKISKARRKFLRELKYSFKKGKNDKRP